MTEHWKPVVGYEGKYEVSDQGRVRSVSRTIEVLGRWNKDRTKQTKYKRRFKGRILTPVPYGRGPNYYPGVGLSLGNGTNVAKSHVVHLLVIEAFVGPRPPGMECRHLDGDAWNSKLENLRWGTRFENEQDRAKHNGRRLTMCPTCGRSYSELIHLDEERRE